MHFRIRKCPNCGRYTLKEVCPVCGSETKVAHPPRASRRKTRTASTGGGLSVNSLVLVGGLEDEGNDDLPA